MLSFWWRAFSFFSPPDGSVVPLYHKLDWIWDCLGDSGLACLWQCFQRGLMNVRTTMPRAGISDWTKEKGSWVQALLCDFTLLKPGPPCEDGLCPFNMWATINPLTLALLLLRYLIRELRKVINAMLLQLANLKAKGSGIQTSTCPLTSSSFAFSSPCVCYVLAALPFPSPSLHLALAGDS